MLVPDPSALADAGLAGTGSQANRGPEEPQPDRVHVAHVLVMHTQSVMRQPSVTRSPDEARAFANQLLARARAGEDVIALARQFSDEPGHENKGGDLGFITRGQTVAPFETAAFALPVGGISDVVQTDFGFHIIKRIE
jgi:parvulin-like peptidyl-prolyl isomerase